MDENKIQKNNKGNLKNLRTYMSDMADTVRENEISVIKVALAEQNKHEREDLYRKVEGTSTKKVLWTIGGLILIAGAVYGSYFLVEQKKIKDEPEQIIKKDSIISHDEDYSLDVTNIENLVTKIKSVKNNSTSEQKVESIKMISMYKEIDGIRNDVGIKELFSTMGFTAPSSLTRSLSDYYMIGIHTTNVGDPNIFMMFQTKDYNYTYAGMLEWEKTLAGDTIDLFEFKTNDTKIKINEREWKDIIINNKDVRVLINENGNILLYYLFVDKNNLLITNSATTIKEIMSRLAIKNIKSQ